MDRLAVFLVALGTSIWCSWVGLAHDDQGAAGVGGLCLVASIWLLVDLIRTWHD